MAGKLSVLIGFGAGYVLGARAGRQRYDQIATQAQKIWTNPRVRKTTGHAAQLAKEKTSEAGAKVAETVSEKIGSGSSDPHGAG